MRNTIYLKRNRKLIVGKAECKIKNIAGIKLYRSPLLTRCNRDMSITKKGEATVNFQQKEEVFWMIQDLKKKGWSVTAIAEEMQVSWPTAKKYTEQIPVKQARPSRGSKLDPYKAYIQLRIQEGTTNCEVLLDELRENGYTGGKSILKDYVMPFRSAPKKQGIPRYETEPGEQAQVDWMDCGIQDFGGKRTRIYGFVMTMDILAKDI